MDFVGLEKLSLVDFDQKLSCTLFTAGCNFRCPFCHNSSLALNDHTETIPWTEIKDFLVSRKGKLDAVVITGGEPTLHKDLVEKIREIKALGYEIKLDTNGTNPEMIKQLINEELIDYIAMDIKNSLDSYEEITGLKSLNKEPILESINLLKEGRIPYEFRTTLINEFHSFNSMEEIGKLLKGAKKYALQKYIDSEYCLTHGLTEVSKENALKFKDILSKYLTNVILRSY